MKIFWKCYIRDGKVLAAQFMIVIKVFVISNERVLSQQKLLSTPSHGYVPIAISWLLSNYIWVSSCSSTGSIRDDPYWTSRKTSLELIKQSCINKVSLV